MIVPNTTQTRGDVSRHYDELDDFYREIWGEHVHHGLWVTGRESHRTAVRQLVDVVAAEAEIDAGDDVLDVGSGYGAAARQIALDYDAHVTAITISPAQHGYALARVLPAHNPSYLLGDWMQNDLPAERFDAVYAIECASHLHDVGHFMREAVRVLRPGGRVVVCAWTASEQVSPRNVRYLLEPICREGRLAHLSTATEYVDAMEKAGALLTEFRDLTSRVYRTWPVAIRRTARALLTHPHFLRYLLDARSGQRVFLLTMFRIWLAYRLGAMRYCLLKGYRPRDDRASANLA
jgi:tocopherol O-methyltransferase